LLPQWSRVQEEWHLPYAFNLLPDPQTSLAIEALYERAGALGVQAHDLVTQYGPCVTILVAGEKLHRDVIVRILEWKLPSLAAFGVSFGEPCMILGSPPTLSLRVTPSDALLALHDIFYTELPEEDVHLHYRPAYWQPHLKLANVHGGEAAGQRLVTAMAAGWQGLAGTMQQLEVVRYPPVQSIWQAPLRSGGSQNEG
jgi:hypothetical protein